MREQILIESDGTRSGTSVTTQDGTPIKGVTEIRLSIDRFSREAMADLTLTMPGLRAGAYVDPEETVRRFVREIEPLIDLDSLVQLVSGIRDDAKKGAADGDSE